MKKILLFAAIVFAAIQVSAAPVDVRTAQSVAQNFVQKRGDMGRLNAPIMGEMKLAHVEMNSQMLDRAVFYIFNTDNGHVVVAGDDRADPILGYGDYPLDYNKIPCNMKALFDMLKEQLEYLQAHEDLQVGITVPTRGTTVEPLLTALWDQEAPYWNQCVINGSQCLTGCPATSAAMVFHFWKYPDYETPEVPGYRCELTTSYWGGASYVNVAALPPVTFDWDHMRDSYSGNYSTTEATAVATLMRYVGQAEHMAYGVDGSGVDADSVSLIANAFKLFGYDEETVRVVKKTSAYSGGTTLYTDAEWAALMQDELAEGRPIVFCAISGGWFGGGHAFNVDGYNASTNKYHINFGWSGTSNNYYALNSFDGYNQYQQMVIGIQPGVRKPRLSADVTELSMECYKNQTATASFTIGGRNLEGNVTVTVNDENGVFSVDKNAVSPDENAKVNETFTVTYAPTTEGEYTATVTVSTPGCEEDIVINLNAHSDYELYRPVMLDIDASTVTSTSFRAEWTDQTPPENVASYTLEVKVKPDVVLLTEADWYDVSYDEANHASDAANYLPDDWTFTGSKFYLRDGFISAGSNSVFNPNCDLTGFTTVSFIIKARTYSNGTNTTITVSTDLESEKIKLAKEFQTYLVVLPVSEDGYVKITTGYYPEIQSIQIYGGEITDPAPFSFASPAVTGDAQYRLIEGITPQQFYVVKGLMPATAYLYRVKSVYVNGTESHWSRSKEVMLLAGAGLIGDVDGDGDVSISDVTMLIGYLLNGEAGGVDMNAADMNQDGAVNISDVTALIDFLLNGAE
ncbi:MAG: C10 family peptidase [Muribaculaceae bacterium]|nr:C10 family peptidase [Muribaculaceae bacterium]